MTTSAQRPVQQTSRPRPASPTAQSQRPIQRIRTSVGDEAWLVTDYTQVRRLLDDDRLGRSHPHPEIAARSGQSALFGGPLGNFDTEAEDHARFRRLLQPLFSHRHMRPLVPRVEALTAGLLDDLADQGPPVDLHTKLALPLPILVICELLGVPYGDRGQFRTWTQDAANTLDPARSEHGLTQLYDYGMTLVEQKRARPADDVISRLCAIDDVADDEAATLAMALLFAGHETTVVAIGLGTLLLLTTPGQWRALLDDPALIPDAVEELLRAAAFGGDVGGIPRYARTDLNIDGVAIRAGDLVLLDIEGANHDPKVFSDPDRVDITRKHAAHLTFGHGAHYCIGAPLARIELNTVFAQMIPRFPSMHLAVDAATLTTRRDLLAGGLTELPVSW